MWDWRVGKVAAPAVDLAVAVGAPSAFPPVLSLADLGLPDRPRDRRDQLAGRAGDPPGRRDAQGLWGNRSWAGADSQQVLASVIRTATQRELNPHAVLASLLHARTPHVATELN
jgi:hypothetical protein